MILRVLFNLNRIDTLKLKKKQNNLSFQFCSNSLSFKDYFRQRKFPNMLKKKILPVISKPDITFSSFMYVFQILQILFTNSHLVSGCLMLNSEIGFWRWSEDGLSSEVLNRKRMRAAEHWSCEETILKWWCFQQDEPFWSLALICEWAAHQAKATVKAPLLILQTWKTISFSI